MNRLEWYELYAKECSEVMDTQLLEISTVDEVIPFHHLGNLTDHVMYNQSYKNHFESSCG